MNLQPLYEIKDRLEHSAVAGTNLMQEDFRLRRAAESLGPLASASPVFARISQGLEKLLAAPPQERGLLLLNVLSLVDAVVYTQGSSEVPGEIKPIPTSPNAAYIPVPYSRLKPLLTALTTTGSGRLEILRAAREETPQLLQDSRVMAAMAADLGDSYGEMADFVEECLADCGDRAVKLLKDGFDPTSTSREMVRRAGLISRLAGEGQNQWYLEMLKTAQKQVREELLAALGHCPDNAGLLRDLAGTEKGKCKQAALWALAEMPDGETAKFWQARLQKRPGDVLYLSCTQSEAASQLVAQGLSQRFSTIIQAKTSVPAAALEELVPWMRASLEKSSGSMLEFWRWTAAHREELDRLRDEKGQPIFIPLSANSERHNRTLSRQLELFLLDSLWLCASPALCSLAWELYERYGSAYLPHAMAAALLSLTAKDVYERFSPFIEKKRLLSLRGGSQEHIQALFGLSRLFWSDELGAYAACTSYVHPRLQTTQRRLTPILEPLDSRWMELLCAADLKHAGGWNYPHIYFPNDSKSGDNLLANLICPKDAQNCGTAAGYFRRRIEAAPQQWRSYCQVLDRCGVSVRGILTNSVCRCGELYWYHAVSLLQSLRHTSSLEKAQELRELSQAAQVKRFQVKGGAWPQALIEEKIALFQAQQTAF